MHDQEASLKIRLLKRQGMAKRKRKETDNSQNTSISVNTSLKEET